MVSGNRAELREEDGRLVELQKPPECPDELWARVLAHQNDAIEYEERQKRLLSSLETGDEKMLDRALVQLQEDAEELKDRRAALSAEMRSHGVKI